MLHAPRSGKVLEQRKDHFISMASHELKTPLTILSALTQLLLERFAAEERQDVVRQLSKMDEQITNLTKLVVDLLDISRMQAGAIKYSPRADTVFVRVAHARDTLTMSVQDFGVGIPKSYQQRLFERFYRVLSGQGQTYPGFGIGLYNAHEIIQRHGGKMWVDSAEGKGSIFSFSLPIREERERTPLT